MTALRRAWARLVSFFRKPELDREFDEELAAHIELATQDHIRRGMSLPEARRRALIELGGIEASKALHRDSRGLPWLDGILQDVRYAVRGLRRSPGFTAVAVMTLAVAIGINAGVFTIADTVLFGGYPQVDPDNRIFYTSVGLISTPEFQDWNAQAKSFSGMAGVQDGGLRLVLQDDSGNSESCDTTQLTFNAFQVLGQRPVIGRDFAPSDGVPGAPSVALLSYAFWERRFGKDLSVVGKSFRLADKPVIVIGVMPPGFTFPTPRVDLWIQIVPDIDRPMFF
jgi:hypothetical protein